VTREEVRKEFAAFHAALDQLDANLRDKEKAHAEEVAAVLSAYTTLREDLKVAEETLDRLQAENLSLRNALDA
jgi:phosphoenolpyruvate-protein kinase (PTS system EI component)